VAHIPGAVVLLTPPATFDNGTASRLLQLATVQHPAGNEARNLR
jgi:hypothetical protein